MSPFKGTGTRSPTSGRGKCHPLGGTIDFMKNEGDIRLSIRQARKLHVLEEVTCGKITNREASEALGLSVRQVQRIKTGFREAGASSLVHGNAGLKPSNYVTGEIRELVAERARTLWKGASASHMSELLLAEAGWSVSSKTINRILKGASLKNPFSHKGPRKRRRRTRMERFGQMLQIDASPFDWLSNGSVVSLHGAIDDATGNVTALRFERTECLDGYFRVLEETILGYGVPRSIYSDAHSIFFSPKPPRLTLVEELRGTREGLTQFGKALDILGVNPIKALSPQAKGRIERLWGTLQHRLVVDLRVAGISSLEDANSFLASYTSRHNSLFSVTPKDEMTAFMPAPSKQDLALILCRRSFRKTTGDSTVSWKGQRWVALQKQGRKALFRRGTEVELLNLLDGQMVLQHKDAFYKLVKATEEKTSTDLKPQYPDKDKAERKPKIPAPDHPWRGWNKKKKDKKKKPAYSFEEIPSGGDISPVPFKHITHDIFPVR